MLYLQHRQWAECLEDYMAHNLDFSNNRANIAFLGSRQEVWHKLGQEMQPGMSIDDWANAAGLNWEAIKVPAIASLEGAVFDHLPPSQRFKPVEDRYFTVRNDTGHVLGFCSDRRQEVQPREVLEWFDRYISVDDRFQLDVAGSLKGGEIIWATATYNGDLTVAGERHRARLLMSTAYDGSQSTINQGTMTRVVCNNTLSAAWSDKRAVIRTRHSTKFNPAQVANELARVAQGFACYKAMGDAMAQTQMAATEVASFFKDLLEIPHDAKRDDVSTRKANQLQDLGRAYDTSVREGAEQGSVWAALQAVTRYVDHDRSTRASGDTAQDQAKFLSSQFGSGAQFKGKAMEILMPRIKDKIPVLA